MKIKKGDIVEVMTGKDAGKRGEVQRVVRGKFKYGRSARNRVSSRPGASRLKPLSITAM